MAKLLLLRHRVQAREAETDRENIMTRPRRRRGRREAKEERRRRGTKEEEEDTLISCVSSRLVESAARGVVLVLVLL